MTFNRDFTREFNRETFHATVSPGCTRVHPGDHPGGFEGKISKKSIGISPAILPARPFTLQFLPGAPGENWPSVKGVLSPFHACHPGDQAGDHPGDQAGDTREKFLSHLRVSSRVNFSCLLFCTGSTYLIMHVIMYAQHFQACTHAQFVEARGQARAR